MTKEKKLTFEEALKRLEEIVAMMEDEKIPLDRALEHYEEGIKLTRFCTQVLDAAEKKIEILSKSPEGRLKAVPFTGEEKTGGAGDPRKEQTRKPSMDAGDQFLF